MVALFYSLYLAMFNGYWQNISYESLFGSNNIKNGINALGKLLTNIFNDSGNYETFGTDILTYLPNLIALTLALITSIGIVVMAVKGVKRAFGIFFMGIRR